MKKIVICYLLLLLVPTIFAETIVIKDDFNRPDNQNISEGYDGGFVYYESPINHEYTTHPYNGEEEAMIDNNQLYIYDDEFCDGTSVIADFSHIREIRNYEDGRISLTWKNGKLGSSSTRWQNYITFGENLQETVAQQVFCTGQGEITRWKVHGTNSVKRYTLVEVEPSYQNKIWVCKQRIDLQGIADNIAVGSEYKLEFAFDIPKGKLKLWIDESFVGEYYGCDYDGASKVNSIAFETESNQGDGHPYTRIDDLTLTINVPDKEPKINPLLEEFAPVFYLHPQEHYFPKEIYSLLNESELKKENNIIKQPPLLPKYLVELENTKKIYIDSLISQIQLNTEDLPDPSVFEEYSLSIYGRAVKDKNNYTHLQYFVFYPFQYFLNMNHEGDWEMVQVTLNPINKIESVSYNFELFTQTYYDLDKIELFNFTHPVVYVGKGSHNHYGTQDKIPTPDSLKFFTFFYKLMNNIKKLDRLSSSGINLLPENFETEINQEKYNLIEINSTTELVDFKGHWGEKTNSLLTTGPRGPKYNSRFSEKWYEPEKHTYTPNIPFVSFFLYSPLDMELTDNAGNLADYYFYTGSENEPEVIIVTGLDEYNLSLDATEKGQFTLDVYFYDNETDTGIYVSYNNISNTENTTGNLFVSLDSEFILYLDLDDDGNYDEEYYPDEYLAYNSFILPDKDLDGVIDFEDNCLLIENPDQNDFNDNGKGDACDSPYYYKEQALEIINEEIEKTRNYKLKKARYYIQKSLNKDYWEGILSINSRNVFFYEFWAVTHLKKYPEIQKELAYADKLILEYKLSEINTNNIHQKHKNKQAKIFYKKGNAAFDVEKYNLAILFYMKGCDL